ncbi:MAG: hypothetical protein AUH87_01335 [Deltaproteobacteria bacterium 13_1_40CM_4_54_4]|nr:MAG: hypothetical protein AUH87_01335 [Deltaproteobacteria bacterium 13_1_40CM_4_54_4]
MLTEFLRPPPRSGLIREALGVFELPRLLFCIPTLARQPRGCGEPVLVLPGYGAGNISTALLQSYLRFLGYRVRGLGRRSSRGEVPALLTRVMRRLISLTRDNQQKVRIVGWSLGGYLAREAARERPDLVHQVITLGTPVIGGPKYTVVAHRFRRRGIDMNVIEAQIESRNQISLTTEACIDRHTSDVEHIEVRASHVGLGFSPDVYKIIAQRLAAVAARRSDEPAFETITTTTMAPAQVLNAPVLTKDKV